jgi:hypothetical protein
MKLQKVKPESRELNNLEKTKALTLSTAIHFLIREMDFLSQTTMYSARVKQTGNLFLKALENYSSAMIWNDQDYNGNVDSAAHQIEDMSQLLSNLFTISLSLGYIDPNEVKAFWLDMSDTMQRHNLPISIDEQGDLSLRAIQLEEV